MPLPTLYWLTEVSKVLGRAIPFFGTVAGLVTLIYDLGGQMVAGALNLALASVSSLDTSMFANAAFGTVASIGLANAVFPLTEAVAIWGGVFTAMGVVIAFRWIKSIVPTIAN